MEFEKRKVATEAFGGIDFNTCTLYIPKGAEQVYRKYPAFRKFKNMVEE